MLKLSVLLSGVTVTGSSRVPEVEWLERVNRHALVARLLTSTVHDVSNALQVVSGAAEVLAMDPSPAAVEKRTGAIVGQAMHATSMLKTLSGFVRAPLGDVERIDLRTLAEQVVTMRQYDLRKLRIDARVEGPAVAGLGRARVLMQAALNLCVNAEQATTGVAAPTVCFSTVEEVGAVSLRVIDNGPGVAPALRDRLFAWPPAMTRVDGEGLGIGLAVSHLLLHRDGGALTYEPASGGGAVFTLRIPRAA